MIIRFLGRTDRSTEILTSLTDQSSCSLNHVQTILILDTIVINMFHRKGGLSPLTLTQICIDKSLFFKYVRYNSLPVTELKSECNIWRYDLQVVIVRNGGGILTRICRSLLLVREIVELLELLLQKRLRQMLLKIVEQCIVEDICRCRRWCCGCITARLEALVKDRRCGW